MLVMFPSVTEPHRDNHLWSILPVATLFTRRGPLGGTRG
jgi:hypothetical protein